MEALLIGLQVAQLVFLLLHDWVSLGRLSNLAAVHALDSRSKLLRTTLISSLPFAAGLGISVLYFPDWPKWVRICLDVLYAVTLLAILRAWWVPYLAPSDSPRAERYRTRFAGTLGFLPKRHGFAPDALHTAYHAVVVATLVLLLSL